MAPTPSACVAARRPCRRTPCGQCGQPILAVPRLDYGSAIVYLQKRKHAAWSGPKISAVTAYICPECGYTEIYATTPARLLEP